MASACLRERTTRPPDDDECNEFALYSCMTRPTLARAHDDASVRRGTVCFGIARKCTDTRAHSVYVNKHVVASQRRPLTSELAGRFE